MAIADRAATSGPAAERRDCPYFGLAYYDERSAPWFFGRETEIGRIVTNLRASRLTLVHADSGVGKSSLLRAGVTARLRELASDSAGRGRRPRFVPVVFAKWTDDPLPALIGAIREAVQPFLDGPPSEELSGSSLTVAIAAAARAVNGTLLVILDQFEEYFLYSSSESPPQRLADELASAINDVNLPAKFVIAIREDAYAGLGDLFKGRIENVYGNYLDLAYLTREAGAEAIKRPVLDVYNHQPGVPRMEIDPELVTAVLDQVRAHGGAGDHPPDGHANGDGRIAAPLLQLVMEKLWQQERAENSTVLRLETLERMEGVEHIVDTHLASALSKLGEHGRDVVIDAFDHLVTPSGGKIAESIPDLALRTSHTEAELAAALDPLVKARILRPVAPPSGRDQRFRRYEIFHDVLAPAINRVIAMRQEQRLKQERIEAEERARKERERARRFRSLFGLALCLLIVALILAGWGYLEYRNAKAGNEKSRSLQLAAEAQANLPSDPDISTLAALEAVKADPTPQAALALVDALPAVRELKTIRVASTGVYTASFSPDGREILTSTPNLGVDVFNAGSGTRMLHIPDTATFPDSAAFSPDGTRILVAGADATARAFDARTGQVLRSLHDPASTSVLDNAVYDRNGSLVAASANTTHGGYVDLWSASGKLERRILVSLVPNGSSYVLSVAINNDGTEVASANGDNSLDILDVQTGRVLRKIVIPDYAVASSVTFSPSGKQLVSADQDGSARVWDTSTGALVRTLDVGSPATSAVFSPDGSEVATANGSGQSAVWDVATGDKVSELNTHVGGVFAIAFSRDGRRVVTADEDGSVKIWGAEPSEELTVGPRGHGPVTSVAFVPGTRLVVISNWLGQMTIWDPQKGRSRTVQGNPTGANTMAVSPDGYEVITLSSDLTASAWRLPSLTPLGTISGSTDRAIAVGPGRELFIGDQSGKGRLYPYGPTSGIDLTAGSGPVISASFDRTGSMLATGDADGTINLWNAHNGHRLRSLSQPSGSASINDAGFSSDGRFIATADDRGAVAVFRTSTGTRVRVMNSQTGSLNTSQFNPKDSNEVITAGFDGTARIWNVRSGEVMAVLSTPGSSSLNVAAFRADGRDVVTGGNDGSVRIWTTELAVPLPALVRQAEARVFRDLTPSDRAQYLQYLASVGG
jgi:WD40 repeat protein